MAITTTALFSACGNNPKAVTTMANSNNSRNTITVSQMIDTVLSESENSKVVIYKYALVEKSERVDNLAMYEYDGTTLYKATNIDNYTIDKLVLDKSDIAMDEGRSAGLRLDNGTFANEDIAAGGDSIKFYKTFSHVEIEGISFMCFSYTDTEYYSDSSRIYYTLIPDTKSTKKATVVYDIEL